MSESATLDALVIGSGPGGYVAGIRLGQLGLKAAVIEKGSPGGVCLNVGCIPSKALIHAAKTYAKLKTAGDFGVRVGETGLNLPAMQKWKEGIVGKLTSGVRQLLKGNRVQLVAGTATVLAPTRVEVEAPGGEKTVLEAKALVLAVGSRPIAIPGFPFAGRVVDSTGALAFAELPRRLVVIGGGFIGVELGTVWAKLGSEVTIVEALPQILTGVDPECVAVVSRKLRKLGVKVLVGARARGLEEAGDHGVVSVEHADGKLETLDADRVLVTVGRRANTDGSGIPGLGLAGERGLIAVDRQGRTSVPGVYAIGDITAGPMLAHKASREAEVVAETIAGHAAEMTRHIPAVVFSDPEIAQVGLTEAEAVAAGRKVKVGKFPFAALGRALSVAETDGFAKVVVAEESGVILGAQIVGNGASDLLAEASLAVELGARAGDVARTIHAHPTLPEAFLEAAKAALGEAIHILPR